MDGSHGDWVLNHIWPQNGEFVATLQKICKSRYPKPELRLPWSGLTQGFSELNETWHGIQWLVKQLPNKWESKDCKLQNQRSRIRSCACGMQALQAHCAIHVTSSFLSSRKVPSRSSDAPRLDTFFSRFSMEYHESISINAPSHSETFFYFELWSLRGSHPDNVSLPWVGFKPRFSQLPSPKPLSHHVCSSPLIAGRAYRITILTHEHRI